MEQSGSDIQSADEINGKLRAIDKREKVQELSLGLRPQEEQRSRSLGPTRALMKARASFTGTSG